MLIENKIVSQEGQKEIVSEKIITEDQAVAEIFNKFFINIIPKYLLIMAMIMVSSPLMIKLQTLSISLGIIQVSL